MHTFLKIKLPYITFEIVWLFVFSGIYNHIQLAIDHLGDLLNMINFFSKNYLPCLKVKSVNVREEIAPDLHKLFIYRHLSHLRMISFVVSSYYVQSHNNDILRNALQTALLKSNCYFFIALYFVQLVHHISVSAKNLTNCKLFAFSY